MQYENFVGGLAVVARPNIANAAIIVDRKFGGPTQRERTTAKRTLRYLKQTGGHYFVVGGHPEQQLNEYSDADWIGDPANWQSTSRMVFFFGGSAISWTSRRQGSATLSSMEAMYMALSESCQGAV